MAPQEERHALSPHQQPLLDDEDITLRPMFSPAESPLREERVSAADVAVEENEDDLTAQTRSSSPITNEVRHQASLQPEVQTSLPTSAASTLFSPTSPLSPTSKAKVHATRPHKHQQRGYTREPTTSEEDLSGLSTYEAWKARTVIALQKADKIRWTKCMLGYMTAVFLVLYTPISSHMYPSFAGLPVATIFLGSSAITFGALIEAVVTVAIIGPLLSNSANAIIQSIVGVYDILTPADRDDLPFIKLLILLFITLVMSYYRSRYPRIAWASTTVLLTLINNIDLPSASAIPILNCYRPMANMIFAALIVLACNALSNVMANRTMKNALTDTLAALKQLLRAQTAALVHHRDDMELIEKYEKEMMTAYQAMQNASGEACLEVTFGYIHPRDTVKIGLGVTRLVRHVCGITATLHMLSDAQHEAHLKPSTSPLSPLMQKRVLHLVSCCESVLESIKATIMDPSKFLPREERYSGHALTSRLETLADGLLHLAPSAIKTNFATSSETLPADTTPRKDTIPKKKSLEGVHVGFESPVENPSGQKQEHEPIRRARRGTQGHKRTTSHGLPLAELNVASAALNDLLTDPSQPSQPQHVGKGPSTEKYDVATLGADVQSLMVGLWSLSEDLRRLAFFMQDLQDRSGNRKQFFLPWFGILEDRWRDESGIFYRRRSHSPDPVDEQEVAKSAPQLRKWRTVMIDALYHFVRVTDSVHAAYAAKACFAVFVTSLPALLNNTRSSFSAYSMSWTTYFALLCMDPTFGGTARAVIYRAIGATLGAVWGYISWWSLLPGNPYVIVILLLPFAAFFWWLLLETPYRLTSMMAFIAYNSVILPLYMREEQPESNATFVLTIAIEAVAGSFVALTCNLLGPPRLARTEVRKQCASVMHELSILYEKLAVTLLGTTHCEISSPIEKETTSLAVPRACPPMKKQGSGLSLPPSPLIQTDSQQNAFLKIARHGLHAMHRSTDARARSKSSKAPDLQAEGDQIKIEAFLCEIQSHVLRMEEMLNLAEVEPDLERPFSYEAYSRICKRIQTILNIFYALSDIMIHAEHVNIAHRVRALQCEPEEMVACLVLYFHVCTGSMAQKSVLPTFPPPARCALKRWMQKCQTQFANESAEVKICLSAWGTSTGRAIDELDGIRQDLEMMMGKDAGDL